MPPPQTNESADQPALTVFVIDDDEAMRRGLKFLLSSAGYIARVFESGQAFLDQVAADAEGCLLLDVRMPGMSGLELLDQLRAQHNSIPVIFVTAFGNISMAVRAMKNGAVDFIEKPFDGADLLDRIRKALAQCSRPVSGPVSEEIRRRLQTLSSRELEVMDRVVAGMLNKQIAADLDVSIKTVEIHRARVMGKMQAESLAALVRMASSLDG